MPFDVTKAQPYNAYEARHADIARVLDRIEAAGEVAARAERPIWDLSEMGTLAEIVYHAKPEAACDPVRGAIRN